MAQNPGAALLAALLQGGTGYMQGRRQAGAAKRQRELAAEQTRQELLAGALEERLGATGPEQLAMIAQSQRLRGIPGAGDPAAMLPGIRETAINRVAPGPVPQQEGLRGPSMEQIAALRQDAMRGLPDDTYGYSPMYGPATGGGGTVVPMPGFGPPEDAELQHALGWRPRGYPVRDVKQVYPGESAESRQHRYLQAADTMEAARLGPLENQLLQGEATPDDTDLYRMGFNREAVPPTDPYAAALLQKRQQASDAAALEQSFKMEDIQTRRQRANIEQQKETRFDKRGHPFRPVRGRGMNISLGGSSLVNNLRKERDEAIADGNKSRADSLQTKIDAAMGVSGAAALTPETAPGAMKGRIAVAKQEQTAARIKRLRDTKKLSPDDEATLDGMDQQIAAHERKMTKRWNKGGFKRDERPQAQMSLEYMQQVRADTRKGMLDNHVQKLGRSMQAALRAVESGGSFAPAQVARLNERLEGYGLIVANTNEELMKEIQRIIAELGVRPQQP